MTLGEKLIAAREARGWTAADAARAAGLNRTTLVQIEGDIQDRKNLRLVTVIGLLDALAPDIQMEDFLDGTPLNRIDRFVVKLRRNAA